jgi:ACS family tartrate transporter-like MFS transporter
VLVYLPDGPRQARWLSAEEQRALLARLADEQAAAAPHSQHTLREAMQHPGVWLLALVYLCLVIGNYGFGFFLPQIIQGFGGLGDFEIGLISALPYVVAAVGMVVWARHSDQTGERHWHTALALLAGAAGLALGGALQSPPLVIVALSVAALGILGSLGPFWSLPTAFLSGTAAAGGIALINSVGNLGGFFGPFLMGYVKTATQSYSGGLLVLAGVVALGALLVLGARAREAPTLVVENVDQARM